MTICATVRVIMNAEQALKDLIEVSPQIDAAVITARGGSVHASSFGGDDERASELGGLSEKILAEAERARTELGREPVVQCEIATGQAHVFVVADATHVVTAVTGNDPTVGLVFYDLKTALRALRGSNGASGAGSANGKASTAGKDSATGSTEGART